MPREFNKESKNIARSLIRSFNGNNVLKDLLNDRKDIVRRKVEAAISKSTTHIRPKRALNYNKIFNSLLKTAKPEISRIVGLYTKLQQQVNESNKLYNIAKKMTNPESDQMSASLI